MNRLFTASLFVLFVACKDTADDFYAERVCVVPAPAVEMQSCYLACLDNDTGDEEAEDYLAVCKQGCADVFCAEKAWMVARRGSGLFQARCRDVTGPRAEACRIWRQGAAP